VVLVINNMGGGGAERVLATLASYLRGQLGWHVTIVTLQGDDPSAVRCFPELRSGRCTGGSEHRRWKRARSSDAAMPSQ